ncbi:MAG: phage tail terminator family protein [Oscillospiraceae bacterium]
MNADYFIKLIAKELDSAFVETKVYTSKVEQNLLLPCFFISLEKANCTYALKENFNVNYTFKIVYISSNDLCFIGESLFKNLRYLNDSKNKFKGKNMKFSIKGNELHFYIDMDINLKTINNDIVFNSLEGNFKINE